MDGKQHCKNREVPNYIVSSVSVLKEWSLQIITGINIIWWDIGLIGLGLLRFPSKPKQHNPLSSLILAQNWTFPCLLSTEDSIVFSRFNSTTFALSNQPWIWPILALSTNKRHLLSVRERWVNCTVKTVFPMYTCTHPDSPDQLSCTPHKM